MDITAKTLAPVAYARVMILSTYKGRNLGAATTFLGYKIDRDRAVSTLTLACLGLTTALLGHFGTTASRPYKLLISANTARLRTGEHLIPSNYPYAELIGSLLYLSTFVRPEMAHAAGLFAPFMDTPEDEHWHMAKGVLRYLVGTTDLAICYSC